MTEEERRRCIILGGCPPETTQEQALAEEIEQAVSGKDESYLGIAKHLLSKFRLTSKKGRKPTKLTGVLALALAALLFNSGCSSLRQLGVAALPGVAVTDTRVAGVAGNFVSPSASLAELRGGTAAGVVANLLTGGGTSDPLGFLLPITLPGETVPAYYAVCSPGKWAARCKEIAQVNQPIVAWGRQTPGLPFFILARLSRE